MTTSIERRMARSQVEMRRWRYGPVKMFWVVLILSNGRLPDENEQQD